MNKPQAKPLYVAYPRKTFGREYGSIERLEALGKFCTSFSGTFLGILFLIYFLECCSAAFFYGKGQALIYLLATALLTVGAIARRTSHLGKALGWNRSVAIIIGLLFVLLSAYVARSSIQPNLLWLLPLGTLLVACFAGLHVSREEMRRYGIRVSALSSSIAKEQFIRALEERKDWEKDPYRHYSAGQYSGEPPSL